MGAREVKSGAQEIQASTQEIQTSAQEIQMGPQEIQTGPQEIQMGPQTRGPWRVARGFGWGLVDVHNPCPEGVISADESEDDVDGDSTPELPTLELPTLSATQLPTTKVELPTLQAILTPRTTDTTSYRRSYLSKLPAAELRATEAQSDRATETFPRAPNPRSTTSYALPTPQRVTDGGRKSYRHPTLPSTDARAPNPQITISYELP
ncbi:hypothetical protein C8Q76DRAFT_803967 [Earliella scabrosa]|nr:hypothetical protein C8Q76DRAFT_803967 [Earliella scabrosa]